MSDGKKILIVTSSLRVGGGAERNAVQLGKILKRRGHHVTLLSFYPGEPKYDWDGEHICLDQREGKNLFMDALEIVSTARKIRDLCREMGTEVVISFLTRMNVQTLLSKSLFGNKVKILVSVRNHPLKRNKGWHQFLMKRLYPKADKVVAQTEGIENILRERFYLNNTVVIPNIVDIQSFKEMVEKDLPEEHRRLYDDSFVFINIGSLTEQKAQCHLLRTFAYMKQRGESRLIILGKGPLEGDLKRLAEDMGIWNRVFFLGEVKNVFPYLKGADCFVLTSLFEGFPNVLIEALSVNLPIISTDCVSGPREILCPELSSVQVIEYPYFGTYGILTKTLKEGKLIKTSEEKPLSPEEKILLDTMVRVYEVQDLRKRYSSVSERVEDFDMVKIVLEWEELFI